MTVEGGVKKLKIARIICWPRDSTLRPTSERGFEIEKQTEFPWMNLLSSRVYQNALIDLKDALYQIR
jgi:hypothetical protein